MSSGLLDSSSSSNNYISNNAMEPSTVNSFDITKIEPDMSDTKEWQDSSATDVCMRWYSISRLSIFVFTSGN